MPRTITLSDADIAALAAIRLVVADSPHPARPAAVALIDRITASPEDGPRFPVVTRSGAQPLDLSQPHGYRCSLTEWRSDWPELTDIMIPAGHDLGLELRRPGAATALQCWRIEAGDPERIRALWRFKFFAETRPAPLRG